MLWRKAYGFDSTHVTNELNISPKHSVDQLFLMERLLSYGPNPHDSVLWDAWMDLKLWTQPNAKPN